MKRNIPIYPRFFKGINRRFPISHSEDPNRLYTVQNGRLFKRGESGQVSRIKGYQPLPEAENSKEFVDVLDIDTYTDFITVLWRDPDDTNEDFEKHYITLKEIDTGYEIHLPFYADFETGELGSDESCELLDPPTGVVVTESGGDTEINWDDSGEGIGYNVYVDQKRDNDIIIIGTNYTVSGTGHDIIVTTVNECGTDKK